MVRHFIAQQKYWRFSERFLRRGQERGYKCGDAWFWEMEIGMGGEARGGAGWREGEEVGRGGRKKWGGYGEWGFVGWVEEVGLEGVGTVEGKVGGGVGREEWGRRMGREIRELKRMGREWERLLKRPWEPKEGKVGKGVGETPVSRQVQQGEMSGGRQMQMIMVQNGVNGHSMMMGQSQMTVAQNGVSGQRQLKQQQMWMMGVQNGGGGNLQMIMGAQNGTGRQVMMGPQQQHQVARAIQASSGCAAESGQRHGNSMSRTNENGGVSKPTRKSKLRRNL